MKIYVLKQKDSNALIDFKNNIERLRKIRSLNIKDLNRMKSLKKQGIYSAHPGPY